jgi:hypothetical protein
MRDAISCCPEIRKTDGQQGPEHATTVHGKCGNEVEDKHGAIDVEQVLRHAAAAAASGSAKGG